MLVVAHDPLARAGLATMLDGQPGVTLVGQISGEDDVTSALEAYQPDVVIWDIGWNTEHALEQLEEFSGEAGPPVVALLSDDTFAPDAWAAGARGMLFRDVDAETLIASALAVSRGVVALDPRFTSAALPPRSLPNAMPSVELTPRERQVLRLLAEGLPNKTIAHNLDISDHTVKFHVNSILSKLGAQSRTEAVISATRLGLILL